MTRPDALNSKDEQQGDLWNSIWTDGVDPRQPLSHPLRDEVEAVLLQSSKVPCDVLEVGCGLGGLQSISPRYLGIDFVAACGRHFRPPAKFIAGSGDRLPFKDNSFDFVISIYLLEHLANPEAALNEIRRVVRPSGNIYLKPAWFCRPWTGKSWFWAPYHDCRWPDRLRKASIHVRNSVLYRGLHLLAWRLSSLLSNPARLRFRKLAPNVSLPDVVDADAAAWLDPFDVVRWFRARGDTCWSHGSRMRLWFRTASAVLISVNKT
jgi:SAM-dependent methyltransferase